MRDTDIKNFKIQQELSEWVDNLHRVDHLTVMEIIRLLILILDEVSGWSDD